MGFCHLEEIYRSNIEENYWMMLQKYNKNLKTAEATGELTRNKVADKIEKKTNPMFETNSRNAKEIIIPK